MLKRIYESASCKRKKAIAKADALRAVTEEDETNNPLFSVPEGSTPEVATNPECRSRLRQDPTTFLDAAPESKICEKPDPESLFTCSSRSPCGFHIWHFLSENIAEFRLHLWKPESE